MKTRHYNAFCLKCLLFSRHTCRGALCHGTVHTQYPSSTTKPLIYQSKNDNCMKNVLFIQWKYVWKNTFYFNCFNTEAAATTCAFTTIFSYSFLASEFWVVNYKINLLFVWSCNEVFKICFFPCILKLLNISV